MGLNHVKIFHITKDIITKLKRQNRRNICKGHIFDKHLVFRILKELITHQPEDIQLN
jgi:hypothetical protein